MSDDPQRSHIKFNDHLRWDVFSRELDKLSVFCIWNVSVPRELVAWWMLNELASKGVRGQSLTGQ